MPASPFPQPPRRDVPRAPAVRDVVTLSKGFPLLLVATPSAEAREAAYPSSCAVTLLRPDMISKRGFCGGGGEAVCALCVCVCVYVVGVGEFV